jgi:hypothetical protein
MIAIAIERGGFNAQFKVLLGQAQRPTVVLMAAGRELANRLRAHFRMKEQSGANKLSSRRKHFWLQVMQSVNDPMQTGFNAVSVRVSDPRIAQKVFGGTITAKRAGALTIPVSEKAYGLPASTFEQVTGLKLFILGKKQDAGGRGGVLAAKVGEQIEVEYVLMKSVEQAADPTALPAMSELEAAVLARARAVVDRQAGTN